MAISPAKLVAHRGFPKQFPENTLPGIISAIEAGALNVEVDIQINDEGIAFLMHDSVLSRVGGVDGCFHSQKTVDTNRLSACEPERLGHAFVGNPFALFAELLPIIRNYKSVDFFLELKEASIIRYGVEACITNLLELMEGDIDNCIFISFSESAVLQARTMGFRRTGIVTNDWEGRIAISEATKADYLFIDQIHIPEGVDITANIPVIVYEEEDADKISAYIARGAYAVETFNVNGLIARSES